MCGSKGFDDACCPSAQVFQEKICGNFKGSTTAGVDEDIEVWSAPAGDYFEGTFEIYNSNSSTGEVTGTVTSNPTTPDFNVNPGNSITRTALRPTSFTITAGEGESGKYCITLYKKVLP